MAEKDDKHIDAFDSRVTSIYEKLKEPAKQIHRHLMKELSFQYKDREIKKVIPKRWSTIPDYFQNKYTRILEQKVKKEMD